MKHTLLLSSAIALALGSCNITPVGYGIGGPGYPSGQFAKTYPVRTGLPVAAGYRPPAYPAYEIMRKPTPVDTVAVADTRRVNHNPHAVLMPALNDSRQVSYLTDINYVLRRKGYIPVSPQQYRGAPNVLRFDFNDNGALSVNSTITLYREGVPFASGYEIGGKSLTDQDGACRAVFNNSLGKFENSLEANERPKAYDYGAFARNRSSQGYARPQQRYITQYPYR